MAQYVYTPTVGGEFIVELTDAQAALLTPSGLYVLVGAQPTPPFTPEQPPPVTPQQRATES